MAIPIRQVARELRKRPAGQAVVGGLIMATLGAAMGWQWLALVGLALSVFGEPHLHARQRVLTRALRAAVLGMTSRVLLRILAALALLAHKGPDSGLVTAAVFVVGTFMLGRSLHVVLAARLRQYRRPAIETRNIPLGSLPVAAPPPAAILRTGGVLSAVLELLVIGSICLSEVPWVLALVGGLGAGGVLVVAAWCEWATRRVGGALRAESMVPAVQEFLDDYRPEVVLYSGDNEKAAFHIKMWLTTFERLSQRGLIVVRDRRMVDAIGRTALPIACVPSAADLMALDLESVRAAFYVVNTGNNIHMLKLPHAKSVFIGHGDSDKLASSNPYSRVYSQVWVAGPAGRDRYRKANVGIADESVVEVGRPQLESSGSPARREAQVPTILYAPTWEGWEEAQEYGSVASHGVALATEVLSRGSGVRFLYRPHPFTGRRDPAVAAAHREIMRMIKKANDQDERGASPSFSLVLDNPLSGVRDRAMRAVISGRSVSELSAVQVENIRRDAEDLFWQDVDPSRHLVMKQRGPSLMSCFGQADVLVTDVSSVLSDFISTGRPYAVCNTSGRDTADFLLASPSASAGMILDPGNSFDEVLKLARGEGRDEFRDMRIRLRDQLIGPVAPSGMERFQHAVDNIVAVSAAR